MEVVRHSVSEKIKFTLLHLLHCHKTGKNEDDRSYSNSLHSCFFIQQQQQTAQPGVHCVMHYTDLHAKWQVTLRLFTFQKSANTISSGDEPHQSTNQSEHTFGIQLFTVSQTVTKTLRSSFAFITLVVKSCKNESLLMVCVTPSLAGNVNV